MNHFNDGGDIGCVCSGVRLHLASHTCRGKGAPSCSMYALAVSGACTAELHCRQALNALQTGFQCTILGLNALQSAV